MLEPCLICGRAPTDRCHIKSRGAGGTWEPDNVLLMCREHHVEQHRIGWARFALRYPVVFFALRSRGWEFEGGRLRKV